jgi:hypothetical protein
LFGVRTFSKLGKPNGTSLLSLLLDICYIESKHLGT